jgi:O-antigen/teichoic acid export membrane protein
MSALAKNTAWNLIGQLAPMLAAVFAIPWLIAGMGIDRFGVLTLAWMVLGYFSVFDLGLGRALIVLISEQLGAGRSEEIPRLFWTAIFLMLLLGVVGGAVMWVSSGWLSKDALMIPVNLISETTATFQLLAVSVPIVIVATGLRGVLEAYQRFDLVNLARVPMSVLTYLSPLCILPFSDRLDLVVLSLLAVRVVFFFVSVILVRVVNPELLVRVDWDRRYLRRMLGFGGWMTVTNLVGPFMMYLDRFAIGSMLGMAAVAYYVTPYELVTKLLVVPGALVGVLFPMFASSLIADRIKAVQLFWAGIRWIFIGLFPAILVLCVFAEEGLALWLSEGFAQNSTLVLQWLAVGVLINSLAFVPFGFIQAAGRPDLTAKLHLLELVPYLGLLWSGMTHFGLEGVAIVWTIRVTFDAIAMFVIASTLDDQLKWRFKHIAWLLLALTLLLCGSWLGSLHLRLPYAIIVMLFFGVAGWYFLLLNNERDFIKRCLIISRGSVV